MQVWSTILSPPLSPHQSWGEMKGFKLDEFTDSFYEKWPVTFTSKITFFCFKIVELIALYFL